MYLYCLDCDVKVTIMWIKFEKTKQTKTSDHKLSPLYLTQQLFSLFMYNKSDFIPGAFTQIKDHLRPARVGRLTEQLGRKKNMLLTDLQLLKKINFTMNIFWTLLFLCFIDMYSKLMSPWYPCTIEVYLYTCAIISSIEYMLNGKLKWLYNTTKFSKYHFIRENRQHIKLHLIFTHVRQHNCNSCSTKS